MGLRQRSLWHPQKSLTRMSFEIRSHYALIRNLIDVLKSHLTPQNRSSMESFQMLSAIVTFRFLPPLRSTLHNGKMAAIWQSKGWGDAITKCWSIFGTGSHDQIFSDVIIFHKYVSPPARSPLHLNWIFWPCTCSIDASHEWDQMKSKTSHPPWGVCRVLA